MGIISKFKLKKYDENYYEIYKALDSIDYNKIPSFRKIKSLLNIQKGEKLLDAGCGDGHLLNYFCKNSGGIGYGIDSSEVAIKLAKKKYTKLKFSKQDLKKLKFEDNYFDKIVSYNVIEHIKEQDDVMEELKRVLKKDGILVIGTVIRNSLCWKLYQLLITEHTHIKEFSVKEFKDFVGKHFSIDKSVVSSGVFRIPFPFIWIFHNILKSDIIIKARKA